MKLVDQAGGLAAVRHAQCSVVTVAIDQMTMDVRVEVIAEDPIIGTKSHTNTAYLVYVALDDEGRPKSVPRLIAESEMENKRMEDGQNRQKVRLARRQSETHGVDP
jgi:acyl-CoA hydrolase